MALGALLTAGLKLWHSPGMHSTLALIAVALLLLRCCQAALSVRNARSQIRHQMGSCLYSKGRSSGEGVLLQLLNSTVEQETKEVLLGYLLMLRKQQHACSEGGAGSSGDGSSGDGSSGDGLTEEELDAVCEEWVWQRCGERVDFETDDALDKLLTIGAAPVAATALPPATFCSSSCSYCSSSCYLLLFLLLLLLFL